VNEHLAGDSDRAGATNATPSKHGERQASAVGAAPEQVVPKQVIIEAPAKINLYLDVLGQRPDGYHEIDTVMQTVSLADRLTLRSRTDEDFRLTLKGHTEDIPDGDANLVVKAARAFAERLRPSSGDGTIRGADIELEKRIPPGSGLGGGSSDAAAALVGLRRLWDVDAPNELLEEVAAGLGSDVPFFIRGGAARCTGRGEIVEHLQAEGTMYAVLVLGEPLSTKCVYEELASSELTGTHSSGNVPVSNQGNVRLEGMGEVLLMNTLEVAAFLVRPGLREVKELLLRAGASQACLSGSGSCVYGLVESERGAEALASEIAASGLECAVVKSIGPRC